MKSGGNSIFFPILLNLQKYPCLVVGGGNVALRKVLTLREFNASITVLSPKFCKPLLELKEKGEIRLIKKTYSKEFIKNFKMVFSATDNEKINQTVFRDCKEESILLNVVDDPELCDFILPAIVKRGDLSLSISSQGSAPFYAKEVKNRVEHLFPPYYEKVIEFAGEFRKLIFSNKKYNTRKVKEKAFRNFFSYDWPKVLSNEGKKKANKLMQRILDDIIK